MGSRLPEIHVGSARRKREKRRGGLAWFFSRGGTLAERLAAAAAGLPALSPGLAAILALSALAGGYALGRSTAAGGFGWRRPDATAGAAFDEAVHPSDVSDAGRARASAAGGVVEESSGQSVSNTGPGAGAAGGVSGADRTSAAGPSSSRSGSDATGGAAGGRAIGGAGSPAGAPSLASTIADAAWASLPAGRGLTSSIETASSSAAKEAKPLGGSAAAAPGGRAGRTGAAGGASSRGALHGFASDGARTSVRQGALGRLRSGARSAFAQLVSASGYSRQGLGAGTIESAAASESRAFGGSGVGSNATLSAPGGPADVLSGAAGHATEFGSGGPLAALPGGSQSPTAAAPPVNGKNVTPWQSLLELAELLVTIGGLLLMLCEFLGRSPQTKGIAVMLAWIAAICGALGAGLGAMIAGQGQTFQGLMFVLSGGIIAAIALKTALTGKKDQDEKKPAEENQTKAQDALKNQDDLGPKDAGQAQQPASSANSGDQGSVPDLSNAKQAEYGPGVGEWSHDQMYGHFGALQPGDCAVSPDLLADHPYGSLIQYNGEVYRVADVSYISPGVPNTNTVEIWRPPGG